MTGHGGGPDDGFRRVQRRPLAGVAELADAQLEGLVRIISGAGSSPVSGIILVAQSTWRACVKLPGFVSPGSSLNQSALGGPPLRTRTPLFDIPAPDAGPRAPGLPVRPFPSLPSGELSSFL